MKLIMESWNKYLKEEEASSNAVSALEDLFGGAHYDGSLFHQGFKEIIDEDEDDADGVEDIASRISPQAISQVVKKYSKGKSTSIDMSEVKDPVEIAILNSILLFTTGHVATVRNPEKFDRKAAHFLRSPKRGGWSYRDPERATYVLPDASVDSLERARSPGSPLVPPFKRTADGKDYRYMFKPTRELYILANRVLGIMASMENPAGSTRVHRGIRLTEQILDGLKEGAVFHPGGEPGKISSWTTSVNIAKKFWCGGAGTTWKDEGHCVLFIIKSCEKGVFMGNLSGYRHEKEFLLSAPVRITEIRALHGGAAVDDHGIDFREKLRKRVLIYCDDV